MDEGSGEGTEEQGGTTAPPLTENQAQKRWFRSFGPVGSYGNFWFSGLPLLGCLAMF